MSKLFCPSCFKEYDNDIAFCTCGYPFSGKVLEQNRFLQKLIKNDPSLKVFREKAKTTALILFVIGFLNIFLLPILLFTENSSTPAFYLGTALIGLGFYARVDPKSSIIFGLLFALLTYLSTLWVYPKLIISFASLFMIVIILVFIIGLMKLIQNR
jgi:hypothetical protein